jgi:hypothetical protein
MEGNPRPNISFKDEAHYYKGRQWIADNLKLKKQILAAEHDLKGAVHMGQDQPIKLVRQKFFWPEMEKFIEHYVRSCSEFHKNKATGHAHYGLLQPLE